MSPRLTLDSSWAEDHGYMRYRCGKCGRVFWSDGNPSGECCDASGEVDDEEEAPFDEWDDDGREDK